MVIFVLVQPKLQLVKFCDLQYSDKWSAIIRSATPKAKTAIIFVFNYTCALYIIDIVCYATALWTTKRFIIIGHEMTSDKGLYQYSC